MEKLPSALQSPFRISGAAVVVVTAVRWVVSAGAEVTAGAVVAGTVVAGAERDQYGRLSSYVGSGKGLVANVKVLCGLDLTLAQRLNLLNMLYGQQAANEAAAALQQLEDK